MPWSLVARILWAAPMAALLLNESATVTMAHSKTADLPALCRQADILVAAVGRPQMVKSQLDQTGCHCVGCRD